MLQDTVWPATHQENGTQFQKFVWLVLHNCNSTISPGIAAALLLTLSLQEQELALTVQFLNSSTLPLKLVRIVPKALTMITQQANVSAVLMALLSTKFRLDVFADI